MKIKLRIKNVSHTYKGKKEVKALKDITLDIYENEFVTIIGPSGCGKTTLLQIIAGFIIPTKGKVYCNDKDVTGQIAIDRCYVFQEDAVSPWITVRKNVEFPLLAKG